MDKQNENINKRIVVTGASGFIGRACLKFLTKEAYEIHALSSRNMKSERDITWHKVDLVNPLEIEKVFSEIKPYYLLHLAWDVSRKDYQSTHHYDWIVISLNLLKAFAFNGGKRIVAAGTCAEYSWKDTVCIENSTPIVPNNTYAFCKDSFHTILKSYCQKNELTYAWGRIFFAYGPGENPTSLMSYLIDNLKRDQEVEIKHALLSRDYIHSKDIANAFVHLVGSSISGPVNISSGKAVTLAEIAGLIGTYFNKNDLVGLKYNEEDKNNSLIGQNERLIKELQVQPLVDLETGILETIESINT